MGKEKKVDYLLAVGGGSVIDGTKLISAGILYEGDAWDLVLKGCEKHTLPLGTVLTLPATGSEMNSGAVISRQETAEKYPFYSNYPVFSILDPDGYLYFASLSGRLWNRRYFCARHGAIYDHSGTIPPHGQMGGRNCPYFNRDRSRGSS